MKISFADFTSIHPTEEGRYLWIGEYSLDISLITVIYYPPSENYGLSWEGYYGVVDDRGRNVECLQGKFLKLELE